MLSSLQACPAGLRERLLRFRDSAVYATTVLGVRLSLKRELAQAGPQQFDLLVMDPSRATRCRCTPFTSEAFRLYAANDESILAVIVTNR